MEIILTIVAILCQYKHNGTILKLLCPQKLKNIFCLFSYQYGSKLRNHVIVFRKDKQLFHSSFRNNEKNLDKSEWTEYSINSITNNYNILL